MPREYAAKLVENNPALFSEGIFNVAGIKFDSRNVDVTKFLGGLLGQFESIGPYALGLDVSKDYDTFYILGSCEGPYEDKNTQIKKGDIVIDAGAHDGDFSALASLKGAIAYAFEPSSATYDKLLLSTAKINAGLPGKIIPVKAGLSDSTEVALFEKVDEFDYCASLFVGETEKEEVQLTTIDDFVNENNLSSVDFIKADIEGAERLMLKGAKNAIKDFGPKMVICTYHLPDDKEVLEDIVCSANPKYVVEHKYEKMYCYVPE